MKQTLSVFSYTHHFAFCISHEVYIHILQYRRWHPKISYTELKQKGSERKSRDEL